MEDAPSSSDTLAVYSKSNNGTTIDAFVDDNADGENDLSGRVSYKIQSGPVTKGVEELKYPTEVDTQGEIENNAEEDQSEEEENKPKLKKVAKKKVFAPEIMLIEPKGRIYANYSAPNQQPCGGLEKGSVHYIAVPGSKNYF